MDTLVSLAGRFPLPGLVRDLHPLDDTHAGQTKERHPLRFANGILVIPLGFEPKTHALEGRCSNPTELRNLFSAAKVIFLPILAKYPGLKVEQSAKSQQKYPII